MQEKVPDLLQSRLDSLIFKLAPDEREAVRDIYIKPWTKDRFVLTGETDLNALKEQIIIYLKNAKIIFYDSLKILPDTLEIKKPWGLISVSVCNMKVAPSHSSEMASQAIMGTPVKILKKRGGWIYIQTPDFYLGWANDSGVEELTTKEFNAWKQSDRLIFTERDGDIMSAQKSGEIVSDIVSGVIVVKSGESGSDYKVVLPDGRIGLVPKEKVASFNKWSAGIKPDPGKMARFAETMLGYPYMWGGTSTKMMDCSGFTKTIYFTGGVILARDASLQFLHGTPVDISGSFEHLEPGDLLYFGNKNSNGDIRITHTGYYIGNSELIHSPGKVCIISLDSSRSNYSSYRSKSLMGARRIIGAPDVRGTQSVRNHPWYF